MLKQLSLSASQFSNRLKNYILGQRNPYLKAQKAFKKDDVFIKSYGYLSQSSYTKQLFQDIKDYIEHFDPTNDKYQSFIALFPTTDTTDDIDFENQLWAQLYELHLYDDKGWDPDVDSNPNRANFSFSIHGEAFHVVGMHPGSPKKSRRSPVTALVFHLHHQHATPPHQGVYQRVKKTLQTKNYVLQPGTVESYA